jgi:hypothetical protein
MENVSPNIRRTPGKTGSLFNHLPPRKNAPVPSPARGRIVETGVKLAAHKAIVQSRIVVSTKDYEAELKLTNDQLQALKEEHRQMLEAKEAEFKEEIDRLMSKPVVPANEAKQLLSAVREIKGELSSVQIDFKQSMEAFLKTFQAMKVRSLMMCENVQALLVGPELSPEADHASNDSPSEETVDQSDPQIQPAIRPWNPSVGVLFLIILWVYVVCLIWPSHSNHSFKLEETNMSSLFLD